MSFWGMRQMQHSWTLLWVFVNTTTTVSLLLKLPNKFWNQIAQNIHVWPFKSCLSHEPCVSIWIYNQFFWFAHRKMLYFDWDFVEDIDQFNKMKLITCPNSSSHYKSLCSFPHVLVVGFLRVILSTAPRIMCGIWYLSILS